MKKLLLLCTIIFTGMALFGQAPLQLNFQGAARNAQGNIIANKNITVRLSVLSSVLPQVTAYSETRSVTTSMVGLFNIVIGSAGALTSSGTMGAVNWATGNKYLLLEIDPDGRNNFINLGTTQLQSVPFALNANSAAPVGDAAGDLSGTYPNPLIGDGKVTTAKIANGAVTDPKIISVSGIKVNGDIPGSAGNVTGIVNISNGGTGASNAADARRNLGLGNVDNTSDADKPVSTATALALNKRVQVEDTSAMLAPYATIGETTAGLNLKVNIADTAAMLAPYASNAGTTVGLNLKVNISDTSAMLSPYASNASTIAGLDLKVNIADTAAMLAPYASYAGTTAGLNLKLNIADTANMLNPYAAGIHSKVNITDTAAMLAPYASNAGTTAGLNLKVNIADTANMLNSYAAGINAKVNIADTAVMLAPYASNAGTTAGLNLKVNIADTANMLSPYAAGIHSKVNIADTAVMLAPYASTAGLNLKVNIGDTANMLSPYAAGIHSKVNIADTAAMLAPYASNAGTTAGLNLKVNIADTANMLNSYAAGINAKVNIADTAVMLAPYASNAGTTAGLNLKVNIADTANMLSPYAAGIHSKVNIADTAAMLAPYASTVGTTAGLNLKVNIADTAAMLAPYASNAGTIAGLNLKVNIADTAAMLNPYAAGIHSKVNIADTAAMLAPYASNAGTTAGLNLKVNIADTANMLNPYAAGILAKVNIADTAAMLAPYASNAGTIAGLNLKVNIADTAAMLAPYASNAGTTAGLNLKVNIADTAAMLAPYASSAGTNAGLNLKLNIADTAAMLAPYASNAGTTAGLNLKVNIADTAAMLNPYAAGINSKVDIADTAAMLAPYASNAGTTAGLNLKVNIADTAAMLAPYASKAGTIAGLNLKVNIADTASMLNPYAAGIHSKVNISDTAAMLAPYASNAGTIAGLNLKVNIADTASMLNSYAAGINSKVNIADTAVMLAPYASNAGTTAGLNLKVNIADTAAMLNPYAAGINAKVNITDTAAMLAPYASNAGTITGLNLKLNIADTAAMLAGYGPTQDHLNARITLTVAGKEISGISNDSTTANGDSTRLITERAAKAYVRNAPYKKFGIDDVLANQDRVFTGNGGNYNFEIAEVKALNLEGQKIHLQSGLNQIQLENDSLRFLLKKGQLTIDSLRSTSSMLNKQVMVRDSVGDVVYGISAAALGLGDVTGAGTVNFTPKWNTGGKGLVNSQIFDDGTKVGIGTTAPTALLSIKGDILSNNGGIDMYETSTVGNPRAMFRYTGAPYRHGEYVPKFLMTYNNALQQNLPDSNGNYTAFIGFNEHEFDGNRKRGVIGISMEALYNHHGKMVQEFHLIHNFNEDVKESVGGGGTRFLTFAGQEDGKLEDLNLAADLIGFRGRYQQAKFTMDNIRNNIFIADSVVSHYETKNRAPLLQLNNSGAFRALPFYSGEDTLDVSGVKFSNNGGGRDLYNPSLRLSAQQPTIIRNVAGQDVLSFSAPSNDDIYRFQARPDGAFSLTQSATRILTAQPGAAYNALVLSPYGIGVTNRTNTQAGVCVGGDFGPGRLYGYMFAGATAGQTAFSTFTDNPQTGNFKPLYSSINISGNSTIRSANTNTGGSAVADLYLSTASTTSGSAEVVLKAGSNTEWRQGVQGGNGGYYFGVGGSALNGSTNVMYMAASGNVGIGTTTPAAKLEVAGSVKINNGNLILNQFQVNPPSVFAPVSGSTVPPPNSQWVIINPAGSLAALTITLPDNPVDGQLVEYSFRQDITALTVTAGAGGASVDSVNAAIAKTSVKWGYSGSLNSWIMR